MVKIAVCLYGQPRNYSEGCKNIKKFVENHDVDFYYHTWILNSNDSYYRHSENRHVNMEELKGDKDIITNLNLLYNPKAHIFEESKSSYFDIQTKEQIRSTIAYSNTPNYHNEEFRISNTMSQLYSRQQVRNLLYNIIQTEKIEYDFVIMIRFDFLNKITVNIDLNNINKQLIYVSDIHKPSKLFADGIFLLNVDNFFKMFNIYDNLDNLINNKTLDTLCSSYNVVLALPPEHLIFANYLYYFNDIKNLEYVNFPNFHF
jgi:hypothetical protein